MGPGNMKRYQLFYENLLSRFLKKHRDLLKNTTRYVHDHEESQLDFER